MRQALVDMALEMRESVWLMATKEGRGWADRIEALAAKLDGQDAGLREALIHAVGYHQDCLNDAVQAAIARRRLPRCPTCKGRRSRECSGRHLQDWHPNHSGCNDPFHAETEVTG